MYRCLFLRFLSRFEGLCPSTTCALLVFVSAALPISAIPAFAQNAQSVTELPEVVVEGATLAAPAAKPKKATAASSESDGQAAPQSDEAVGADEAQTAAATAGGVPVSEVGSAVTVITSAQLKARQIRYAADALRSVPGVSVGQTGSPGGKTQVRIRGAEANHTLVVIDGIEANDPNDGDFDWSNLPADDIERIEVIRGAQSGIYGSKAIGGVINVITKSGRGPISLSAQVEYGGYDTTGVAVRASGGTERAWLAASAQYREQNEFNIAIFGTEDDPWDNATVNLRGGFSLLDNLTLGFVVRNTNKFVNTDPEQLIAQTGLSGAVDGPNTTDVDFFLGGLNLRWDMFDNALTHVFKANRTRTGTASTSGFGDSDNIGEVNTYSYLATYRFATPGLLQSSHSLSGFIEHKQEGFTPISAFTDGVKRERENLATVAEYRGSFYDRVFVGASVRKDDNDTISDFTTWRSSVAVDLHELGLRPHASVGTGVALPGLFEQFGAVIDVFVGNPDLEPEESFSWDAGVEFTLLKGTATLDVTYFEADLTDEIAGFGNSLINLVGTSERRGIEVAAQLAVMPNLWLGASYTYLDATEPDGTEEIRRAPHSGRADVTYRFDEGRGTFNVAAVYNGEMTDRNFLPFPQPPVIVTLDEYWLVTAGASYELKPGFELYGRVENLLDERYEEVSGFNTLGIAAYAGVRVKLEDTATASWAEGANAK